MDTNRLVMQGGSTQSVNLTTFLSDGMSTLFKVKFQRKMKNNVPYLEMAEFNLDFKAKDVKYQIDDPDSQLRGELKYISMRSRVINFTTYTRNPFDWCHEHGQILRIRRHQTNIPETFPENLLRKVQNYVRVSSRERLLHRLNRFDGVINCYSILILSTAIHGLYNI